MSWYGNTVRSLDSGAELGAQQSRVRPVLGAVVAVLMLAAVCAPGSGARGLRDELTVGELLDGDPDAAQLVDDAAFAPPTDAQPPLHAVAGRLTVPRSRMQLSTTEYPTYRDFPGFSVDFFSHGGVLAPVTRSLMTTPGNWSLILSPGRIWSEPGDDGMSRASFPFVLASPPDRVYAGGEAHNGVATFLIGDAGVSDLRFQVTQETAPDGDIFDMWGVLPLEYTPAEIADIDRHRAELEEEIADCFPIRAWSELEERHDPSRLAELTEGLPPDTISAAGVIVDDTMYLQPSRTRRGEYPYPAAMQHGAMSISKSIGAGIAMLWLAEVYGPDVFDLRIVDFLEVDVGHDGWDLVTFGDVLNMATGIGDNSPQREPFDVYANETGASYRRFYVSASAGQKLDAALSENDYPWGPGEVLRYTSAQTFVLAAAMDAFLKEQEGPDAHLWERLSEAVFEPIGIHHMTMIHVPDAGDGPGIPLLASGLRLSVDDLAKVVTLLQNGGSHAGRQLLHPGKLDEALYRTGALEGLPSGKSFSDGDQAYHMSFWALPYRTDGGDRFQVPFMSGAGGSTVFLAQNGVSTFVFTDHGVDTYSLNSASVAEAIRPFPSSDLESLDLLEHGNGSQSTFIGFAAAAVVCTLAIMITWRHRSKAH